MAGNAANAKSVEGTACASMVGSASNALHAAAVVVLLMEC